MSRPEIPLQNNTSTSTGLVSWSGSTAPRYTGLRRELDTYLHYYNTDRVHHGHLTHGRIPADIVYGARKMEAR